MDPTQHRRPRQRASSTSRSGYVSPWTESVCGHQALEAGRQSPRTSPPTPGGMQDHRDRGGRCGHSSGHDQLPACPGRRDGHRRGLFPLSRPTSRSRRSCSRSSPQAHSSATARTGPAPQDQEIRRLPRPQARRAQRHQRHPENRVPPAQPMDDHLTQGHWALCHDRQCQYGW